MIFFLISLGRLRGLLGNYNGIADDDFIARNGSVVSPSASERQLHYDFGMTCKSVVYFHLRPGRADTLTPASKSESPPHNVKVLPQSL